MIDEEVLSSLKDMAAIAAPLIAPLVAVLVYRLELREKAYGSVGWKYFTSHHGEYEEIPFLVIHNRSDQSVAIKDVRYRSGIFKTVRSEHLALDYEDPSDIDFPYVVEPYKLGALRLDERQCVRIADSASLTARILSWIGRPRIWVQAITTTGKKITVSAEGVIPYSERPSWLQGRNLD